MAQRKVPQPPKKTEVSLARSSAAEYLTFVAATGGGNVSVEMRYEDERAVQFRKWANQIVKDDTIQGWVMDVDRLKNGGSVLTEDFFER